MKLYLIGIAALINCHVLEAQVSPGTSPEVITEFHWSGADLEPFANKWPWTGGQGGTIQDPSIAVEWHDKGPVSQTIRTLGSAIVSQVTCARYAIVGKLKYENVTAGSYLEMLSYFAPEKNDGPEEWYYSRTLADAGPMAKLEGTDEGRDFILPFDSTGAKTKLERIVLNLHLGGAGGVELSDVKLVQYPDISTPTAQTPTQPGSSPEEQVITELSPATGEGGGVRATGDTKEMEILPEPSNGFWWIKDPQINVTHYAVTGEIRYENISSYGYLEMANEFAADEPGGQWSAFYVRTLADQGPLGRLKGTSDWRVFWLPFDSSKIKTRLARLRITLRLADQGTVYVRNVKLVQYPGGTFPASLAPDGTIPPPQLPSGEPAFQEPKPSIQALVESKAKTSLDWRSLFLGVAVTILTITCAGSFSFLMKQMKRRRHERELRRIASLDS